MKSLIQNIKKHEGFRAKVYKDTLGFDTVGFGFKVDSLTADELALNGGRVAPMSAEVAEAILELKLQKLESELKARAPHVFALKPSAREACFEMAYQMGIAGFLSFKRMHEALKAGDFERARGEALNSEWAKQTPKRAEAVSYGFLA